jgi:hypothetical protein
MEIEIRDTRNGSWYWVNTAVNACPHISVTDKAVYAALCSFGGYSKIKPTYKELSDRCRVPERTCKSSVSKLVLVGIISIENYGDRGVTNIYTLLKVANGCEKCSHCTTPPSSATIALSSAESSNRSLDIDKKDNTAVAEFSPIREEKTTKDGDAVPLKEKKISENDKYEQLCQWAEKRRGFPFVRRIKQYTALKTAKQTGISPSRLKDRWEKQESEGWRENKIDWTTVVSSFDKEA